MRNQMEELNITNTQEMIEHFLTSWKTRNIRTIWEPLPIRTYASEKLTIDR